MVLAFNHRKYIDIKSKQECYDLCDNTDDSDPKLCLSPCVYSCKDKCSDFEYFSSPPPPPPPTSLHHSHKPREFLTISVTLIAVALLAIALYIVYIKWKASRQRRRSGPQINQTHDDFVDEDHGPVVDHHVWYIQTVGLQPAVINAISVCKFKKGDGLVEGTECSVCLNEFQEDETLRLLPKCSHAFHIPCIDTWLRSHTNCPMCRAPIVKNIGSSSSSSPAAVVAESSSSSSSANESGDTQMEVSEENGLGDEVVVEGDEEVEEEEIVEMQPMRRSVSVDSLSAMKISQALVISSDESSREPKRVNSSRTDSLARFVASASIRRSLSCSGKLFLSRSMRIDRI